MSVAFRRLGQALAVALVTTSALLAPAAGQTGDDTPGTEDGPTDITDDTSRITDDTSRTTDSTTGTTDTTIGTDGTVEPPPVLNLEPDAGLPGSQVTASGGGFGGCSSNDDVGSATVTLIWDGTRLQAIGLARAGTFSTTFEVPSSASLDTSYVVTVRCAGHGDQEASTEFTVTAPATVPDTPEDVDDQSPPAETRIGPGAADDREPSTETPALVAVPDLVDGTVDEARAALASVGLALALADEPDGDSAVVEQAPTAGTLVPAGSTVTVTVEPAPVPAPVPAPIADRTPVWLVAVVLILLVAALAVPSVGPWRRGPKWVRTHVRIVRAAEPARQVEVTHIPAESPPTCVVRIEPHPDRGVQVLEEVPR